MTGEWEPQGAPREGGHPLQHASLEVALIEMWGPRDDPERKLDH